MSTSPFALSFVSWVLTGIFTGYRPTYVPEVWGVDLLFTFFWKGYGYSLGFLLSL
jgi:hypothetical protein